MGRVNQADYLREELVILALQNQQGNLGLAAMELGISRGDLYDYILRHEEVAAARRQIKEAILDTAEDLLVERMKTSDSLLMFFLRTQGKDRGYEVKAPASGAGGVSLTINARTLIAAMRDGSISMDEGVEISEDVDKNQDAEKESIPIQLPSSDISVK